ncbi:hypothetical protein Tco_0567969 [Tanacetum coccineum]
MALPPRAQRHQYLMFEGLEYTDVDIANFEERLGKIYGRGVHRVQVFNFGGLTDLMAEGLSSRMLMEHRDTQGQIVSEVAWSPTLEANDGICICSLGSWVVVVTVVVVCSRRPAPTVLGQVAKLPAVSAFWCTRTVMVEVTLRTSRFSPFIRFPVTIPGSMVSS